MSATPSRLGPLALHGPPFLSSPRPRLAAMTSWGHSRARAASETKALPITSSSRAAGMRRVGSLGAQDVRLFLNGCIPAAAKARRISNCGRPVSHLRWPCHGRTVGGAVDSLRYGGLAVVVGCGAPVASDIPSVGLTRPVRPRFGMSNRRPSSLRSASIPRPQRPFAAFFPWALRAHSSRDKKASPWPPSTSCRPFGCGPIAFGQRQPSRSRWSRPENRKRIRTWLPSATSP